MIDLNKDLSIAIELHEAGKISDALKIYVDIFPFKKRDPNLLFLIGTAYCQIGNYESGLVNLKKSIELNPSNALAQSNLGKFYIDLKKHEDAVAFCDKAIELDRTFPEAYCNRGVALQELNRIDDAIASYDQAICLKDDYADAHSNRGRALHLIRRLGDAVESYKYSIKINPMDAKVHSNLGAAFQELNKHNEAIESYECAIRLNPIDPAAFSNRGVAFHELMQLNKAVEDFKRAIDLEPDFADSYWNLSLVYLLTREYKMGWKYYEWRWKTKLLGSTRRFFDAPTWLGNESLSGKLILIFSEQGLGDVIQFSRYIPMLVEQGAKVIFEVPQPLVNIMQTLPCDVTIVESGTELPSVDLQCPIMSLPLAFNTTVDTIPANIPYLFADPVKNINWEKKFLPSSRLKVGLVWSGGFRPNQPEVWSINERRNIPLTKLESLNTPDVDFYSLQKGDDAVEQLQKLIESGWQGPEIIDFSNEIEDFSDTAALIDNLDLVIAVDTSTAHLAGAMGKQVWLLNRFDTDWRWFVDKDFSPWYPTVRIFRQPTFGDWDTVISDVKESLKKLVSEKLLSP